MEEQIEGLMTSLKANKTDFNEVVRFIESMYTYDATTFRNGELFNNADQNQGSGKVFSFAKKVGLSETDTLSLFAEHYQAVLASPGGDDHQNIRQFMAHGWAGINFEKEALIPKVI